MTTKDDLILDITPKTLVGDLLKNFPQLEDKLIEIAPVFKKLKNPVLRRTIAKVTTLKQASIVGGVSLSKMINELRSAAGLEVSELNDEISGQIAEKPEWIDESKIVKEYDAREDLENGIHPAAIVTKDMLHLKPNQIYLLVTPFVPAPLIKIIEEKGFETFTEKCTESLCKTYLRKKDDENTL